MNNIKTQGGEDEFRELDQVCVCHQGHLALGSCGVTGGDGLYVEKRQGTGKAGMVQDTRGIGPPFPFSKAGLMLTFPGDLALDWA